MDELGAGAQQAGVGVAPVVFAPGASEQASDPSAPKSGAEESGSGDAPAQPVDAAAAQQAEVVATVPAEPQASEEGHAGLDAFLSALGAFRLSAERYLPARVAFDRRLAGCDELTPVYRAADDAFLRLSRAFASARDGLGNSGADDYEAAADQMHEIDAHFDGSECPRPG
ncbi:MAG: hypothetical protein ACE5HQ_04405 [Gemmatimonadota bacterium]